MVSLPILDSQKLWNASFEEVLSTVQSRLSGLHDAEVLERQQQYGLNIIHKRRINTLLILLRQLTGNPLILVLGCASTISFLLGQEVSFYVILSLILVSVALGFWNEFSAEKTVDSLLKKISPTALVVRNDEKKEIPVSELTIGDIVLLSQGSIVPADLRLLLARNLEINESVLTGESISSSKTADTLKMLPKDLSEYGNTAFMGTSVETGVAKGVVVAIGKGTEFGKIAKSTLYNKPETEFQKGLRQFGQLLVKIIAIFTVAIFVINTLLGHPFLDSLLFSLAIAVGLTPELLPVIVTVSLSHGAGKLAKKKVIAKQLIAIENLGNMDVLCTDKTGTLTEGSIEVVGYFNLEQKKDAHIFLDALICNVVVGHHKVIGNGIDEAIWKYAEKNHIHIPATLTKLVEEPFDYNRKAMFTVVDDGEDVRLIVKGAPQTILSYCKQTQHCHEMKSHFEAINKEGLRVVAIAEKRIKRKDEYTWDDVNEMSLHGYVTFLDIPKTSAKAALQKLEKLHVDIKVITGDNEIIAGKVCQEVGLAKIQIVLGADIEKLSDEELKKVVEEKNIFARVNPEQKVRIVQMLKNNGHTVGYLGDGINDIPCLRSADVGISVNTAIDVAKDAAAIVLLHKGLDVLAEGIVEGRRTFNNTIKYILMGTSSNFGNMFSAAGASFLLPFLPMTPVQILLTNGLYDLSQLTIPTDNVDHESLVKPRHWNIDFIRNYMIFFGPISSLYDFLTFGLMFYVFHAQGALFQTGWFIESIATEILVVFVIRTARKPFFFSRPSNWLTITCLGIVLVGIILPFSPLAQFLGFVSPPPTYFLFLIILVSTYLILVEILKDQFLKKYSL